VQELQKRRAAKQVQSNHIAPQLLLSCSSPPEPQPLPPHQRPRRLHNHRNHVRRGDRDQAFQVRHWCAPPCPPVRDSTLTKGTAGTPPTEVPQSSQQLSSSSPCPRELLETAAQLTDQASTPASRTRTRPSTAGRTTSTTTSASPPRVRTLRLAARY
jgi:hypothetical protein